MDRINSFVKRIPGSPYSVGTFKEVIKSRAVGFLQDGDWIYERQVIESLCKSSRSKQLLLLYRRFAAYRASQPHSGKDRI